MNLWKTDKYRRGALPAYQYWYRRASTPSLRFINLFNRLMLRITSFMYNCEIPRQAKIGYGLYIGHPFCITINPKVEIGCNCNIHKGLTIGQENRGERIGVPKIGNEVWIGVNVTIVGAITIGDDVLIAPNTYVNTDIPSHSVVFGNPCIIKPKQNATEDYINRKYKQHDSGVCERHGTKRS